MKCSSENDKIQKDRLKTDFLVNIALLVNELHFFADVASLTDIIA